MDAMVVVIAAEDYHARYQTGQALVLAQDLAPSWKWN